MPDQLPVFRSSRTARSSFPFSGPSCVQRSNFSPSGSSWVWQSNSYSPGSSWIARSSGPRPRLSTSHIRAQLRIQRFNSPFSLLSWVWQSNFSSPVLAASSGPTPPLLVLAGSLDPADLALASQPPTSVPNSASSDSTPPFLFLARSSGPASPHLFQLGLAVQHLLF